MNIGKSIEETRFRAIEENTAADWMTHAENCIEQLHDGSLRQEVREHVADEARAALVAVRELEGVGALIEVQGDE